MERTPPPEGTPKTTVATYGSYAEAERAVDFLSDREFPVERVAIVGTGLKTVEQVAGRLTTARAALAGAAQGAMIGLLFGLLLGPGLLRRRALRAGRGYGLRGDLRRGLPRGHRGQAGLRLGRRAAGGAI
jgi:hypothetical protein